MKKIFFLISLFCAATLYAQTPISLDVNDLGAPVKHYNFRVDTAVDVLIVPGAPGANLAWNFAALHSNHDTVSVDLVDVSSVPMHSYFPAANIATVYDSSINVYFFNSNASGLTMHGIIRDFMSSSDSLKLVLSTPDTMLTLPANYGDSRTGFSYGNSKSHSHLLFDTSFSGFPVQVPIDTVHIIHRQNKTTDIDAWGNVTLPNNSFPALRQKDLTYTTDSVWGYANTSAFPPPYNTYSGWYYLITVNDTTTTYTWWKKSYGVPVVKMTMAHYLSNQVKQVEWAYDTPSGITENEILNSSVFPNPSNDFIYITNISDLEEVVIFDIIGNEISRQNIGNNDMVKISVQDLANGLYFYNAYAKHGKTSGKFIVKH